MTRNILHIQIDESLCPSMEDMEQIANLFKDAAVDPNGATVVTISSIDCELRVEDTQEGNDLTVVTASIKPQEVIVSHDVLEIWRVGRIEGHRVYCYDDEELYADVSAEYIDKFALNLDGYYVRYGNGEEGFLISGVKS